MTGQAIETPQRSRSQSLAWRASELNRALALVRPVSMTDETASDWLAAAVAETADMTDGAFREAVAEARKTCTYHGQIIPAMTSHKQSKSDPLVGSFLANWNQSMKPSRAIGHNGTERLGDVVKRIAPK